MRALILTAIAIALSGCATAMHSELQQVPVRSTPPGADVTLDCGRGAMRLGTTPMTLMLRRRDAHCSVSIAKNGFVGTRVDFHRVPSAASLGNVVPALLAGVIVTNSNVDFSASNGSTQGGVVDVSGSGYGSVSPGAIAGIVFSGGLLIDAGTGTLFAQRPAHIDVSLVPAN